MIKSIEIKVLSIKEISKNEEKYLSSENAAIICSSYGERLKKADRFNNWLVTCFADIENKDFPAAIKSEHAELIKKYVDSLDENIKRLYICTDRGVSRGPAIKAALLSYQKKNDMSIWKNPFVKPNALVYFTLCHTFGIKFSKLRTSIRKRINGNVLKKTITKNRKKI